MPGIGPEIMTRDKWIPDELSAQLAQWSPRSNLGRIARECFRYLPTELAGELLDRLTSCVVMESELRLTVFRSKYQYGDRLIVEPYGLVGHRVVTDVGVGYIVDSLQNIVEPENLKYHGLGTGSTSEAAGDTALVTELTTEYTGNVRATGTTTETSAAIYTTVATNTLDGTPGAALREHGVFSANAAGVLLDRTVYSSITLSSGDSLQSDYRLTFTSGS